jgi:cytochrome o ubiquinol oxidase operon protein cyoD
MIDHTHNYFEEIGALPREGNALRIYGRGFVLSLILTALMYFVATSHTLPRANTVALLVLFALVQCVVQFVCFLHLNASASRAKLFLLACASLVVLILVSGSLWIMFTLNSRMMPSEAQMQQYMNDQGGF